MKVNAKIINYSEDDAVWSAPVDFETLREFRRDPKAWVSEHIGSELPNIFSYDTVTSTDIEGAMPAVISGVAHRDSQGKLITLRVTVGINRAGIDNDQFNTINFGAAPNVFLAPASPPMSYTALHAYLKANYEAAGKYPFDLRVTYDGAVANGAAIVHSEMLISRADAGKVQDTIQAFPNGIANWLNLQKITSRLRADMAGITSPINRNVPTLNRETFVVDNGVTPIVHHDDLDNPPCSFPCAFSACNSNLGTFEGDPENDQDVIVHILAVDVKDYCRCP